MLVVFLVYRHSVYIEFRTHSSSGLIFLAENPAVADMVGAYLRKGQLVFARRCRSGRVFEVYRKRFNNDQWHAVGRITYALHQFPHSKPATSPQHKRQVRRKLARTKVHCVCCVVSFPKFHYNDLLRTCCRASNSARNKSATWESYGGTCKRQLGSLK